jgi:hypothetical protein
VTADTGKPDAGEFLQHVDDEFEDYLAQLLTSPAFARAYYRAAAADPGPLPVNGREYHRRQVARRRSGR